MGDLMVDGLYCFLKESCSKEVGFICFFFGLGFGSSSNPFIEIRFLRDVDLTSESVTSKTSFIDSIEDSLFVGDFFVGDFFGFCSFTLISRLDSFAVCDLISSVTFRSNLLAPF